MKCSKVEKKSLAKIEEFLLVRKSIHDEGNRPEPLMCCKTWSLCSNVVGANRDNLIWKLAPLQPEKWQNRAIYLVFLSLQLNHFSQTTVTQSTFNPIQSEEDFSGLQQKWYFVGLIQPSSWKGWKKKAMDFVCFTRLSCYAGCQDVDDFLKL